MTIVKNKLILNEYNIENEETVVLHMNRVKRGDDMQVYHGSPEHFETFDYHKIGIQGTTEGFGFYFTDTKRVAEGYAQRGFIHTAEWLGRKSLSQEHLTIDRNQFREYLIELDKQTDYLSNWGEVAFEGLESVLSRAIEGEYDSSLNDVELVAGVIQSSGDTETCLTLLYQMFEYDSIVCDAEWGGTQTLYIALVHDAYQMLLAEKI